MTLGQKTSMTAYKEGVEEKVLALPPPAHAALFSQPYWGVCLEMTVTRAKLTYVSPVALLFSLLNSAMLFLVTITK